MAGQDLSQGFLYPEVLVAGPFVAPRTQTLQLCLQGPDSGGLVIYLSDASFCCDVMVLVEYRKVSPFDRVRMSHTSLGECTDRGVLSL